MLTEDEFYFLETHDGILKQLYCVLQFSTNKTMLLTLDKVQGHK
jgi:hypothetical protein